VVDPYVEMRIGAAGTKFADKDASLERQSHMLLNRPNPTWNFAARWPVADVAAGTELHILVKDGDIFSADDLIGEVCVPLASLQAHAEEYREYPLAQEAEGCEGGALYLAYGTAGSAFVLGVSSQIELKDDDDEGSWWGWLNAIGQFMSGRIGDFTYYRNMAKLLLAGQNKSGSASWWLHLSESSTGAVAGVSIPDFPREQSTTYISHAEVHRQLRELGPKLGSNNADGR